MAPRKNAGRRLQLPAGHMAFPVRAAGVSIRLACALDEKLQVYDATNDLSEAFVVGEAEEADAGKAQAPVSGKGPTQGETPPAAPVKKTVLRGRRGRNDKWNFFASAKAPEGGDVIQADVNGAFNMMRKVFRHFRWHAGLTPKFLVFKFDHDANLSR